MNSNRQIIIIADNIRSTHNIGSLFRTGDAFGVKSIYFTGISATPERKNDPRLPHVIKKSNNAIKKVALGAEETVPFKYFETTRLAIKAVKESGFTVCAIEQSDKSSPIYDFDFKEYDRIAIVVGTETVGIKQGDLELCDQILELPMKGSKESLNASVMTGIALFAVAYNHK